MVFASSNNATKEFHPKLKVLCLPTKIDKVSHNQKFGVYPNPASGSCTIFLNNNPEENPVDIRITDNRGSVIKRLDNISEKEFKIDLSAFEPGIYYFYFYTVNKAISSAKIVVE